MSVPSLSSLLLGSTDPTRLRDWYLAAFEGAVADEFNFISFGDVGVLIDGRDDVAARNPEPGRFILNLHVDDIQAVAARLEQAGVEWLVKPEDRGPGIFATLVDPDGNYLQVIQFAPEYQERARASRAARRGPVPFSGFTVDDVPAAAAFYRDVLRMGVTEANGMLQLHLDPDHRVLVYPKPDHVPATFTVLNLPVADIDATVTELAGRGVEFLRYDGMPQDELGVMRGKQRGMGPDIAWFADPAGNVLSVLSTD